MTISAKSDVKQHFTTTTISNWKERREMAYI